MLSSDGGGACCAGSVAVAGLGISWLQQNLGVISCPGESETLARQVPSTGGVYFVPAFSGLLAPHWDSSARGVLAGLSGWCHQLFPSTPLLVTLPAKSRTASSQMRSSVTRSRFGWASCVCTNQTVHMLCCYGILLWPTPVMVS